MLITGISKIMIEQQVLYIILFSECATVMYCADELIRVVLWLRENSETRFETLRPMLGAGDKIGVADV